MEHSAQGKRSDTLGPPVLEQSRPERAKALKPVIDNVIATVFHVCFYANNSFCSHVQLTKGAYFLK